MEKILKSSIRPDTLLMESFAAHSSLYAIGALLIVLFVIVGLTGTLYLL